MHPRPGCGIGSALVGLALHAMGVYRENHVEVWSKIFQRIPLIGEADGRGHAFEAGNLASSTMRLASCSRGVLPWVMNSPPSIFK